ncbi:hypothetical protein L226DRAFT_615532 [Lentinus tigrinus ALCF2SS1-7]|uniref:Uncharacterized protein n=1 Tax=Lentinus tigrinus ALCF2SS1-6 TaxID=1328759 RepID=A0A5C2RZ29_9APHY|nr:hypothetical protein L227DRAFT_656185 [Lentinus tigrinus ALCF2SS1-6]RPD71530.1 hypothetical protein L226DRAFT_615532 [Lentinus tigrinus ALCF2SS1-7]
MGRFTTPLVQRASPAASKLHKPSRIATRSAQHQKSPYIAAARAAGVARSPGPRARLHSTNTNRFLSSRSQLETIHEEPEDDDAARALDDSRALYRHFDTGPHAHEDTRPGPSRGQDRDDDVDMLGWDEETTLVAMLQESGSEEDEEEQLMAMVEQLKGPMAAQGNALKQYLKETLLPAYNRVKAAHGELDDKGASASDYMRYLWLGTDTLGVDLAYGAGLLTFDEVCKKVERIALRDEDELKTARAESQRNITKTLQDLEEAYARRNELWKALDDDLERCASRAAGALDALSTDIEQTIAILDKKSKALDKDSSAAANQKLLRGLLEKL